MAQRLCSLQPRNNAATSNLDKNLVDDGVEFGFDLDFRHPSRFLLDIPLEDEEILGPEDLTPSTSVYSDWPAADAAGNRFSNVGIKYDLKWLRESCDMIVRGSGSQLSRDELAMTICRVLESDKPGEEVNLEFNSFVIPLCHLFKLQLVANSSDHNFFLLQIAGDLLDLVGDSAFETVQELILVRFHNSFFCYL